MRRASIIKRETLEIQAVEDLTAVFEAIASTQIAKIKDKVSMAQEFFDLLWQRYSSIRIDSRTRFSSRAKGEKSDRGVYIIISAEGGLSGDIDQRLMEAMLETYDSKTTDIVVIGSHGSHQLAERGISYVRSFSVPESETYVDVSPIIDTVIEYGRITVYYEVYVSLGVQEIKTIDLLTSIREMGGDAEDVDIITDKDTIFEPSLEDIADLMERGMMSLGLSQAILESGLAQSASRFNAMAAAKKLALELVIYHKLEFHRSKRSESDRRLREILIGMKKKKKRAAEASR